MTMQIAPPESLAIMRQMNQQNLEHRCTIADPVTTPVAGGRDVVTSHTPVASNVPCRLSLASAAEQEVLLAAGITAREVYIVAFAVGQAVTLKQRLTVTGNTHTDAGDVAFSKVLQVVKIDPFDRQGEFLRKVAAVPQ